MNPLRAFLGLLLIWAGAAGAADRATLVILPPVIKSGNGEAVTKAEMACDRLAGLLGKSADVKVVDRTQIDRVLAEHRLGSQPAGPVLSYDGMVRLTFNAGGPVPKVELAVVDLSSGNLAASREFAGDLEGKLLEEAAGLCREAAKTITARPEKRIRVRLVSPLLADNGARLAPLGDRLQQAFAAAVGKSPELCLVHHLEAATAAEESLLLLLGLSRLPGGRQFTPQADATIQLRLAEVESVGRTFDETVVQAEVRVDNPAEGTWQKAKGKVAQWDQVIAAAWQAAAPQVSKADLQAARAYLEEMDLRRRQAQAELDKLHNLGAQRNVFLTETPPKELLQSGRIQQAVEISSAAAKLDPTNEEAAWLSLRFDYRLRLARVQAEGIEPRSTMIPVLSAVLRQLKTYKEYREPRTALAFEAICWVLEKKGQSQIGYQNFSSRHSSMAPADLPTAETLDLARQVVDEGLSVPSFLWNSTWEDGRQIRLLYECMIAAGMEEAKCRRWRDEAVLRAETNLLQGHQRARTAGRFEDVFPVIRTCRIAWALQDGRPQEAREMLRDLVERMGKSQPSHYGVLGDLPFLARQLDAPDLLQRVQAWAEQLNPHGEYGTVEFLPLRWPALDLYGPRPRTLYSNRPVVNLKNGPPLMNQSIDVGQMLTVIGQRLYLLFNDCGGGARFRPETDRYGRFGYIPLKADGSPLGEAKDITQLVGPRPPKECEVKSVAVCGDKLCLGTDQGGLWVYDTRAETWKGYGAEDGLPTWYVQRIYVIGKDRLLCCGPLARKFVRWTVDLASGKVVLCSRPEGEDKIIWGIWQDGQTFRGADMDGIVEDALAGSLGARWPEFTSQGWRRDQMLLWSPETSVFNSGGCRFVDTLDGLRQIDARGQVRRFWSKGFKVYIDGSVTTLGLAPAGFFPMTVPGDLPVGNVIAHDGSVAWYQADTRLYCYDPAADTWYGPLPKDDLEARYAAAVEAGVWTARILPQFHSKSEFLAEAKRQGLVATSAEMAAQVKRRIESSPPLDRAKLALGYRQFETAAQLLEGVLKDQPDQPEALAVMGLLHDWACLNQPAKALGYYRQLSASKDTAAAVTGLYLQCQCLMRTRDWDSARAAIAQAQALPGLTSVTRRLLDGYRIMIDRKLQPAATSHATTRPG